jgi:hypothetical protein
MKDKRKKNTKQKKASNNAFLIVLIFIFLVFYFLSMQGFCPFIIDIIHFLDAVFHEAIIFDITYQKNCHCKEQQCGYYAVYQYHKSHEDKK